MTAFDVDSVTASIRKSIDTSESWADAERQIVRAHGREYVAKARELAIEIRGQEWAQVGLRLPSEISKAEAKPQKYVAISDEDKKVIALSLLPDYEREFLAALDESLVPLRAHTVEWIRNPAELHAHSRLGSSEYRAWIFEAAQFSKTNEFELIQQSLLTRLRLAKEKLASRLKDGWGFATAEQARAANAAAKLRVSTSNWSGGSDQPSTEWWREQE